VRGTPTSHATYGLAANSLSPKDRLDVFDTVWKTINDEYYDPSFNGVNWAEVRNRYRPRVESVKSDEELYALLKQMVRELHDLHMAFVAPNEKSQRLDVGFSVYEVEGKVVVVSVEPNSEAATAGIKAGMVVRTFDDKPIEERIAERRALLGRSSSEQADRYALYKTLFNGTADTSFKLGLVRADGTQLEVALFRRVIKNPESKLTSSRLPSGFGYVKVNLLRAPIDEEFKSEFENLKDTSGLILDLRGVTGCNILGVGVKIADYFFPTQVTFGRFVNRSNNIPAFQTVRVGGKAQVYSKSVVILVDNATASAAEVFVNGFQENGRAIVVGERSCGCVLDVKRKEVKGGGELIYSHLGYISAKQRKLEGNGIVPDKIVMPTVADLQRGRDAALEEAENILKARSK
jgi:carboxyl-terminal processing protease